MKHSLLALGAAAALLIPSACSTGSKADAATEQRDSTWTTVNHPDWSRNAVIYEVNLRQFTDSGTVTAFADHLPRLKELGADILWFMPIHPISEKDRKGTLGSYYAVKDYTAFNPEFGTLEQFKETVRKAHEQGMKVIIDWVPNHTGRDNRWVTEHPDWYKTDSLGNMVGIYDWTDVYVLDYSNPDTRKGMIDAMKFWITEADVDGFRCDVAGEVPTDFWNECREALQQAKPDVFMLAEASKPELEQHAFDMAYNWPMKDLFSEIAATAGQYTFKGADGTVRTFPERHAATAIDSLLAVQAQEYPRDSYMMNMITNHDLNSWEGTEFERLGNLQGAFAVLTYTLPGMPLIYTGQETGMNRAFEFFEKDKAPDWTPNTYFEFYKTLNAMKHREEALRAGEEGAQMKVYATASPDLYVFSREKGDSKVTVLVNLGNADQAVTFTGEAPTVEGMKDLFMGTEAAIPESMAPGAYAVFTK